MLRGFLVLIAFAVSPGAWAWGGTGHRTIGLIADELLSDTARAEVDRLLALEGHRTLANVATWADQIKPEQRDYEPTHSVRVPLDAATFDMAEDCPARRCLVAGIEDNMAILEDRSRTDRERLEALKYIVHFVGDIHMPFHTVDKDLGRAVVSYRGREDTVHKIWDTRAIQETGMRPRELADVLLDRIPPDPPAETLDPAAWALESRDLAVEVLIPDADGAQLRADYGVSVLPAIEAQLTKAGVRLSQLFNEALE
jgi:hypothetical protein